MNNSLKKAKAMLPFLLESSHSSSRKDPIELIKAKEQKNWFLKENGSDSASRRTARDWWWCDDV